MNTSAKFQGLDRRRFLQRVWGLLTVLLLGAPSLTGYQKPRRGPPEAAGRGLMRSRLLPLPTLLLAGWVGVALAGELTVKPAGIAGSWYPDDPAVLTELIEGLLAEAEPPVVNGRLRALISPHAGYRYSGHSAAVGYRLLQGRQYRRILVLAPAHRGGFRGLSIAEVGAYRTPLGEVPLDLEAVRALRRSPLVGAWDEAHQGEHAIEIQLPFLQRGLAPGWRLLPILVGRMEDGDHAAAAELLRPWFDQDSLLLVSSDFTHYGWRFGYQPFPPDAQAAERLSTLDLGAFESIAGGDPEAFRAYRRETDITVCGAEPILILLELLPAGTGAELLDYATSGAQSGDYRHSVSYLSIGFFDLEERSLAPEHLQYLHRLAGYAVRESADPGNGALDGLQALVDGLPETLRAPGGAFVTLREQGRLRGCQGYVEPEFPLFEAVIRNGVNAARHDRRFRPVRAEELERLDLEVSVLTPPEPIASPQEYSPGLEGIVLEQDGKRAVFLPQVPTLAGWDREQTLTALAKKAGLPPDAWRQGARLSVFRTHEFAGPLGVTDPVQ
jgi:AmmeMemoRadiSam system protein B/AmmeMemoRadiSam system protein A